MQRSEQKGRQRDSGDHTTGAPQWGHATVRRASRVMVGASQCGSAAYSCRIEVLPSDKVSYGDDAPLRFWMVSVVRHASAP